MGRPDYPLFSKAIPVWGFLPTAIPIEIQSLDFSELIRQSEFTNDPTNGGKRQRGGWVSGILPCLMFPKEP